MNPLLVIRPTLKGVGNIQFIDPLQHKHHGRVVLESNDEGSSRTTPLTLELYFAFDGPNEFTTNHEMEEVVNDIISFARYAVAKTGEKFPPVVKAVYLCTRNFDGLVWATPDHEARMK